MQKKGLSEPHCTMAAQLTIHKIFQKHRSCTGSREANKGDQQFQ